MGSGEEGTTAWWKSRVKACASSGGGQLPVSRRSAVRRFAVQRNVVRVASLRRVTSHSETGHSAAVRLGWPSYDEPMSEDPSITQPDGTGAGWRAAVVLAWITGIGLQLQQPALWAGAAYALMGVAALGALLAALRCRWRGGARAVAWIAVAAAGFAYAGWRADRRLADALAPEWEGCDVELVGVVDEMPQVADDGEHFAFVVESARAAGMTARDLKRVQSLDRAAGTPLSPAVAGAEEAAARARTSAVDLDDDDDVNVVAPLAPSEGTPVVPSRVWLSWSRNQRDDRAVAAAPVALRAGQRWRLPVRLKRPHGAMNPDGFDAELWLFDQGLRATGVVRGSGQLSGASWAPIENTRQWVRDRLLLSVGGSAGDPAAAGALAALAVGDQAAITGPGWEVFRNTGVAHLMSISGLHITMLGWLGGGAIGALWRRCEHAALWLATPIAARWGGVGVAWLYALLAGWGVPAQRTVLMLAATAVLRSIGLNWPASLVALAAMVPVTLLDPWALLQPGYWLSFAAVGLLMVSEPARAISGGETPAPALEGSGDAGGSARQDADAVVDVDVGERAGAGASAGSGASAGAGAGAGAGGPASAVTLLLRGVTRLRGGVRAQLVASIGLAPLTLVAFQQVSLVGLVANLVAEPWVTLVVTPLTLLGIALPPLWHLAALALTPLLWFLAWLARWPLASVHVPTAPDWALAAGLVGGAVLMLPLPWRVRLLGMPMLLPLLWPFVARPAIGRFELVAADVGQGTAVLVRTREHLLLFDTGPRFGEDNDAGRRMLLPLMQARGEARVDVLMLSHADADHVGGAQSIIDRMPVLALRSSLAAGNPLRANALPHVACEAGQRWAWDGVQFTVLHPFASDYRPAAKPNSISCVLRVVDAHGTSALLTGDVEAPGEMRLVARARADPDATLRSDVLVVPHHGSRTSSTAGFLDAVRPGVAVIQVGYRSRYGHPAPDVVGRYAAHGIPVVRSDHCGAWLWAGGPAACTRTLRRRYWQWQGAVDPLTPAWSGRPGTRPDP
jgi:competence protein ComEC